METMLLQHALTLRPPTGAPPPLFVCLNIYSEIDGNCCRFWPEVGG